MLTNKFAMISGYDEKVKELGDISRTNKEAYCRKHDIDFLCQDTELPPDDDSRWHKLIHIVRYLPRYDWVFWTDADSLIMNFDIKLQPPKTTKDLVLSWDQNAFNCGQTWVRNCPWSYDFLVRCYCVRDHSHKPLADNGSMIALIERNPDDFDHIEIVHQRHFNSYPQTGSYQRGDFMVHFAGCVDKLAMMQQYTKELNS